MYAFDRKKKIVAVVPHTKISPWLAYHAHKIFFSFESAMAYIGRENE
jgi:hypothetical protein